MDEGEIDSAQGDGAEATVSDTLLAELQEELRRLALEHSQGIAESRLDTENVRHCVWAAQSTDGLKHATANGSEPVQPFEGACDMRYRLTDMLINEHVMLAVVASMRGVTRVKGMGATDAARAGKLELVLRWVKHNLIGSWRYMREVTKLAQYVYGDSPGLGMMKAWWRRDYALRLERITLERLTTMFIAQAAEQGEMDEQAALALAQEFQAAMESDTTGEDIAATLIVQMFPGVSEARARKTAKALRDNGEAEFPVRYVRYDGPDIGARRLYEDVVLPTNTTDFQRARCWFERELLTKAEVEERRTSEGWSKAFVDEVLNQEGIVTIKEYMRSRSDGAMVQRPAESYKGLYEIFRAYFIAANDDGIPGRYYVTLHASGKTTAHKRRLLDYAHGKYPGHLVQREVLTGRAVDTRGLAELGSSDQSMLKMFMDSFGDNGQLGAVPPMVTRGRRSMGALYVAPLAELRARNDGDYKWLNPPQYPQALEGVLRHLRQHINEYYGRDAEDVSPILTQTHREWRVMWWLANMAEIDRQILQLMQQYATDELLARISEWQSDRGDPLMLKSVDEIQGEFDTQVVFDPRAMDMDFLKSKAEIIRDFVAALDRDKVVEMAPVVTGLMWELSPDMAETSVRSVERAQRDELEDEWQNYLMIVAGREPDMVDDGSQNYPLRYSMYDGLMQANPAIFDSLAEDRKAILEARLQHLRTMSDQYGENVQIGRQGARRATGQ